MELVLIKKQDQIRIYQGVVEVNDTDVYFLSIWNGDIAQDLVVYSLGEGNQLHLVPDHIKSLVYDILRYEFVSES